MLVNRPARVRQLRDSYIEISKYVRAQQKLNQLGHGPKCASLCVRRSSSTVAPSAARSNKDLEAARHDATRCNSQRWSVLSEKQSSCLKQFERSGEDAHHFLQGDG